MPNGYHDKSGSSAMAVPRDKDRLTAKGWLNPAALPWALLAHCLLFGLLIVSVQYFWLDGKPYLVLGDDAMIAMRYAWHWAQGFGIYWNTNATPEGYSNFLLVGVMAVCHQLAALLGIPINLISGMILAFNLIVALASICLMWLFVLELTRNRTAAQVSAFALAVNAQFLYWGKSGFETTLLVFLRSARV